MRQRIGRRLISIMLSVLMLVSLLPTAVFAEELQNQDGVVITEKVGEETGNTVKNSNENEDSTGGEETKGESSTTKVKVGGKEYTTLEAAIAEATPDENGVITYEIYGKAEISGDQWISFVKETEGVKKVVFAGKDPNAEISITSSQSILGVQNMDIDVEFTELTLSHPDGKGVADLANETNYFACMVRNAGHIVTYTKCTFPNGVCNNQYGKTVFNNCQFTSTTGWNLWNTSTGDSELNGCTFTGKRGVKLYAEGNTGEAGSVKVKDTTFELNDAEKAAVEITKPGSVELDNISVSGTTAGTIKKNLTDGYSNVEKVTVAATGKGISGSFTGTTESGKAKDEFNITGGTFTGAVSEDYLAAGTELVYDEATGTYGVEAAKVASVGNKVYPTLEAAFAALSTENHTLTLIKVDAWAESTPVYWAAGEQSGYVAKLTDALTAAYKANVGDITIVCRPGADVGTMTHGHVADNITIYGNDAYLSGGECDLEVDTYMFSRTTGAQASNGEYLTKDIAINAYELDNLGVWGERHTTYEVNVNLTDCDGKEIAGKENVQRVYISNNSGVTSSVNNITLKGCDFLTAKTAVYSNANGTIGVDGCSFTGTAIPVNINHDGDGAVTVVVKDGTFTNCGDKGDWKNFAAPIRFVNSGSGTMDTTVDSCTFEGTVGKNGDILIGDGRAGKVSNDLSLTVKNTDGWVQAQKPGRYDGNKVDSSKRVATEVDKDVGLTTSIKSAFIKDTTGTRNDPYTLEQLSEMTRDEYIAAQNRLGGTMYVTVGNYEYDTNGVLGNGVRNDTPGQTPDRSKLNSYAENGYLGEGNDGANGKNIVFVNGSITSNVYGYTSIDNIGTSLLLAVPAYTNVTFEGITFNNVMSFDYQLYTSPWSQLGELKFENCVFEGIIVGAIAAQELTFDGCRFEDYENSKSENNSNPTWIRPAYGNWTKDDNEGQGTGFRSLTKITFTNNTVTSTRPVKFERIAQWEMATTVTATGNTFTINKVQGDTSTKNVGMYFGANAKFNLVVDNNTAKGKTAGLYTAVYSAPNDTNYPGLPAGSTVKDSTGETSVDALVWKSTDKLTLKTTEEVAQLTNAKGVVVKFATLQEAIAEAKDGDTVKLLKSCSGNGIKIETKNFATKGLTVDFGGCTYTVGGVLVGSSGTGTNAFQLLKGGKVTFQNGTIAGVTEGTKPAEDTPNWHGAPAIVIQNYCDLTLKDMTVSGGDETVYTVSNNHGNVVIEDSTINAGKAKGYGYGPFAFDVCGYSTYDGVSVTVKGNSTINGDIEVSRSANNTKDVKLALESGTINGKLKIDSSIKNSTATTVTKGGNVTVAAPVGYAWSAEGTLVAAVAQIGENGYVTLAAAIAAAEDGDTVKLLKDVTDEDVTISKSITLDLGGKTLTNTDAGKATISVADGVTATVKNGSVVGGTSFYNIQVGTAVNSTANLTLENVTATAGNTGSSMIDNWGTLTIESGTYEGGLNVVKSEEGSTLTINGGKFTLNHAVSNYYNGVILSAGMTTITGGEFIQQNATTPKWAHPTVVLAMKVDGYDSKIVITGGKFTNKKSGEKIFHGSGKATSDNFEVSGGTFNKSISDGYCAEGFIPTKNADGTYGVKAGKYVAEVKGTKYETLQEAVDAARNTTVKMLADTKENVTIAKAMTLDLNGHTLNGGTEKGKPALTVTARVTVKDSSTAQTGTIMREDTAENSGVSSHYVIDIQGNIQGNGWLTFESGTVKNNSGNKEGKGASLVRVGDDSVKKQPGLVINGGTFTQDNFIVIKVDRGYLNLNGGTLKSANSYAVENWFNANIKGGTVNGAVSSWTYSAGSNSTLTISGGTVNGDVTSVNYGNADKVAKVAITGGTVTGKLDTRSYDPTTGKLTSITDAAKATIKVSGGTFSNDPAKYVVEDSAVTKNEDNTFGVAKAYLAKIGDTAYYTMDEAFQAVKEGETITLLRDYTTGAEQYSGSKSFAIDLNGKTWTYTGTNTNHAAFEINHSDVTLTVKNGTVVSNSMVGLIPSAIGMDGPIAYDNAGLVFEGVTMTAKGHSGIETNGNNTSDTVTLKDSTLDVPNGFGIYFPSSGTLTIENSKINAKTMGVQVCAGSLSINAGSAITVTGDAVTKTENDGAIQDGAAISIVNRTGYKGLDTVTISEGTFVAKPGNKAIKAYDWANKNESAFTAGGKVTIAEEKVLSSSADTGVTPMAGTAWVLVPGEKVLYAIRKISDCEAEINGTYYLKLQDAIDAAQNGATVVLVNDVDLAKTVVVSKTITLDMGGKKLFNTADLWDNPNKEAANWSLISVRKGGDLTITGNGTFAAKKNDCYAVDVQDGANLTIENGTFVGNIHAVYVFEGTATINGGTYSVQQKFSAEKPDEFVLNCYDANRANGTAKIIVNGGTFVNFDPMNNQAEGVGTSFVAAGVGVNADENGSFTAVADMTAQLVDENGKSVKAFEKLSDALTDATAGQTVKLLNSVTGEKYVEVKANVTLDLNGYNITDARLLYVTGQIIDTAVTKGTVKADGYYINRDNEYTPVYDSEKDGYSLFKLSVKTWWYATEKKVQFALDRDMADFSAAVALMNANSNGRRVKAQVEFSWVDSAQNVKGKQAFELGETYMSQYLANASNLAPYVTIKGLETIEGTVSVQVSFVISKDELGNELFTLYGNKGTIKQ